ncbi:ABC transporter ATP-binding protein [Natrinema salifodinae]|uniref:ABC-type D-xylose/L-arabinose transporter n=1 Tax=Natrinema salifodinae TaxID=1202768 RepID=A0A1I0QWG4_9EURY|nr:ABC transporter ATP-binding protein [Natrinema salifodinae]SEW31640.1 carbohydrate ABC transporter ATP-binding protein, CUT1 family [Natrinema salifodinae]
MGRVRLTDTTKRYEDVVAVDDMNIEIEDGEFLTLVGPSGCGKSTTLEMIAGLTLPSEGRIEITGEEVTNDPPKDRDIAMVFQNIALFPHMNVYENISFGLRLRKYDDEEIDERVERAAEIVQLEGMLDRDVDELSGGQQQRVGIARAIVREPAVFLMDEPLANLDAKLRVHMRTEIQRLQKELDITTVYVTHDQEEAMTMSDRIAIINDGELQQCAPPLICYDEPANRFVAGFIGSPSMNQFDGVLDGGRFGHPAYDVALGLSELGSVSSGDEVTLGIRPEDVYLSANADAAAAPSEPITVSVDVLEPMGDQTFAYLFPANQATDQSPVMGDEADQLLVSLDPDSPVAEDDVIDVVFDREKVHLFDLATGQAIAHGVVDAAGDVAASDTKEGRGVSD